MAFGVEFDRHECRTFLHGSFIVVAEKSTPPVTRGIPEESVVTSIWDGDVAFPVGSAQRGRFGGHAMVSFVIALGAGKIDIPRAVSELKSFYDGTITLEVHSQDRDYLKVSKDKLEILWYGREHHERNKEYQMPKK